jgi:replicative DNA helicase
MLIVAGRPGMGKTIFGVQLATHHARLGHPTFYASLEVESEEIYERILISELENNRENIAQWAEHVKQWPLIVDGESSLSLLKLRAKMQRMKMQYGQLQTVVVDHVGLMTGPEQNPYQLTTAIAKGLKLRHREFCYLVTPV